MPLSQPTTIRRTPLRHLGARRRRELVALRKFRADVLRLAKGRCARCRERRADHELEAHHLVGRTRAPGWEHLHDAKRNGAALCGGPGRCHDLITTHAVPDWREWVKTRKAGVA